MKIIDILQQSAELLGLTETAKKLSAALPEAENELLADEEIFTLFNLSRFSIQELCTNYVPVATSEKISTYNKCFEINKLTNFIRIQNIYKGEELVNFKVINRCIQFEEDGEYTIQYATFPEIESLFEEIDFLSNFSPDIAVLGLAAYYSLSKGLFDEFQIFHQQYIDKAESVKTLKMFNMPQRRWEWELSKELK